MKKQFFYLLFLLTLIPFVSTLAYDCEVDGIYYNRLSADELEVTSGNIKYTGDVVIPEMVTYREKQFKVTQIANYAFRNCTGLVSVSIPQSITNIFESTFEGCTGLTTVSIPSSVSTIGARAFYGCKALLSINIPECVNTLNKYTFAECINLESISLPDSMKVIDSNAFENCRKLATLVIPQETTSIGSFAFSGCSNLSTITLPEKLSTIAQATFKKCTNLTSVTLPKGLTSIGNNVFEACISLTSINLPEGLYSIGEKAFLNCSSLTSVHVPQSVRNIGKDAYSICTGLKKVIISDLASWCKIYFNSAESNPLHYAQHLYIDEETELKTLLIDNTIQSIGNYAFYKAENLLSIYIIGNNTPPNIAYNTFGNTCYTWTDLYVSEGQKETYQNTDYWKNFKSISDYSVDVDGIKYKLLSSHETEVIQRGDNLFYSGDIVIPENISFVGQIFNVTSIGMQAFKDCTELSSLSIPNSVTRINTSAFEGCTGLTYFDIPNKVTEIPFTCFKGCTNLSSVTIPESVTIIEYGAFQNCASLTNVMIPNSVSRMGSGIFQNCSALSYITLPDSISYIADHTFYGCDLYSVTIPAKVQDIGMSSFLGCNRLDIVVSLNVTPPTLPSWDTFDWRNNRTLLVPRGSKEAYDNYRTQNNKGWSTYFSNIVEYDSDKGEYLVLKSSEGGKIVYNGQETANDTKVYTVSKNSEITLKIELDADYEIISCVIDGDSIKELNRESERVFTCTLNTDRGHVVDVRFSKLWVEGSVCSDKLTYKVLPNNELEVIPYIINFQSSDGSLTPLYSGYSGDVIIPDSIVIPASLSHSQREYKITSIDNRAFQNGAYGSSSKSLKSVVIGNNVKCINDSTFYNCQKLTSVTIGKNVTSIGARAFQNCTSLSSINIPDKILNIGEGAFVYCASLTEVNIPKDATITSDYLFVGCTSLTNVRLPENLTQIGVNTFYGCSKLTSLTIPDNVTTIGSSAFSGCSSLLSLTIPQNVTSIGKNAFYKCSSLESIRIEEGNAYYDSRDNCNAIIETNSNTLLYGCMNTVIPYGVTSIERNAFLNCAGLSSVVIPNSVTSIGSSAFYGCSGLLSVIIPNSLTFIESNTFYGCI